jgi:hypothetical protein
VSAATQLASHLELASDGFALLVLVCDGREQLDALLEEALQQPLPTVWVTHDPRADDWPAELLRQLERAMDQNQALLLLDASDANPDERDGWVLVLRRLNEYRDRLAKRWARPFVLALPPWLLRVLPSEAPDLWSVRTTLLRSERHTSGSSRAPQLRSRWEERWQRERLAATLAQSSDPDAPLERARVLSLLIGPWLVEGRDAEAKAALEEAVGHLDILTRGSGPAALNAAILQAGLSRTARSIPDVVTARALTDSALRTLRRIGRTAPFDLRAQIARVMLERFALQPSLAWRDEIEALVRSLDAEQPGMWDELLVDALLPVVDPFEGGLDTRSAEALARTRAAELRGETWARHRLPEVLWEHAARLRGSQARSLRAEAMERLRQLALQDAEIRQDLPRWLVRAAQLEADPEARLDLALEALQLWLVHVPMDSQELGEAKGLLDEIARSPSVRTPRELAVLTGEVGPDHPLFERLVEVTRRLTA